jgi:hypothetical protein
MIAATTFLFYLVFYPMSSVKPRKNGIVPDLGIDGFDTLKSNQARQIRLSEERFRVEPAEQQRFL